MTIPHERRRGSSSSGSRRRACPSTGAADYLGAIGQLERFGSDAALSPEALRNVTLALEELVFQCIVPAMRAQRRESTIDVLVEQAESDDSLVMRISWDGEPFNPLAQGDELSLSIVDKVTRRTDYRCEDANEAVCSL